MDNKTDKQLVWESIKAIEQHTLVPTNTFHFIFDYEWKDWSNEDKLKIRALLLSNGLVNIIGGNQWALQLTPLAMVLKETDLNTDGTIKKRNPYKQFWLGVIAALIGAVLSTGLSALLEVWKANNLPQPKANTIVLPKIQVVHDTAWLKRTLPKTSAKQSHN